MKKFMKNPWVLAIGSTVVGGVLLSFVLDWIKGVDWLSSLKTFLKFIADSIVTFLNFELKKLALSTLFRRMVFVSREECILP